MQPNDREQSMRHPIINIADTELQPRPAAYAATGEDARDYWEGE